MDYKNVLNADLDKGFSKSQLEKLIGLPQNNLASFLLGTRSLSKISMLKIKEWEASEKPNPLEISRYKKETETKSIFDVDGSVKPANEVGKNKIQQMITNIKDDQIPRLKGESSIEYRIRMSTQTITN